MRPFVQTVECFVNESVNKREPMICEIWCHFFSRSFDGIPRAVTIKCKHVFFCQTSLLFVTSGVRGWLSFGTQPLVGLSTLLLEESIIASKVTLFPFNAFLFHLTTVFQSLICS